MQELPWGLVALFASTGLGMALLSCLVGMRPKVENPAWWGLYAGWVIVAFALGVEPVFRMILVSSILAGVLYGITCGLLLDRYIANNPWHAERMQGSRMRLKGRFLLTGVLVGAGFGAVVAGIAWGIARI